MLIKKIEIVLFVAIGLGITGQAIMTPILMVLMLMTNDFLSMSLMTDRASPALSPSRWRMRRITSAALVLGALKLSFSTTVLAFSSFRLRLFGPELQTLAFVTLVFGNQALLYALRDRRHLWSSKPSIWVVVSSAADIAITSALALSGTLMAPLPWRLLLAVLCVSAGFALLIDKIKLTVMAAFDIA